MTAQTNAPKVVTDFSKDVAAAAEDGRLDAPAFHRNRDPLIGVMTKIMAGRTGNVIEVGSGTGQHIAAFAIALPRLHFQPTDIVPSHLRSIDAWAKLANVKNVAPAIGLDAMKQPWLLHSKPVPQESLAAILCINVIHISPWEVAENVIAAAAQLLTVDGRLIFYGPFKRNGEHTAPSNDRFDQTLRTRNPAWGVRDIADLKSQASAKGLHLTDEFQMPANNLTLSFQRGAATETDAC